MNQLSYAELQKWLFAYRIFARVCQEKYIDNDIIKFEKLLAGFITANHKKIEHDRQNASAYNIFYLLKNLGGKETIVHSPFLGDLLNINGRHGQGSLYYNAFLEQLKDEDLTVKFSAKDPISFSVTMEKWIGDGFIDILIEYNSPLKKFAIAIENKISAVDQPDQLARYANYLGREFGENFLLIYLTPSGKLPAMPYSIPGNQYIDLESKKLIRLMSYRKEIAALLHTTMNHVRSIKVRSLNEQYLELIKTNFING